MITPAVIAHRQPSLLALALAWLLAWALALAPQPARADGVELTQFATQRTDDGLELTFATRFELSKLAEDALHKGVPLYFVVDVAVFRSRWYWRDARVTRQERIWRLAWQPLTRQYRVSTGGLNQSYASLDEALNALRGVSGWRLAEPKEIDDDGRYYMEFSYRLDANQLPRPMQIGLTSLPGFALSTELRRGFNADFSLKAQ